MRASLTALFAAGICAAALAACGGSSKPSSTRASTGAAATAALNAPGELTPPTPAADFALRDSRGQLVRLSQYRGKAVLLTFLYSHCPDVCPLIVSQLRNALLKLGARASQVQVVAVSVDPSRDTSKAVNAFLVARDMTGRMEFLIGSKEQLAPVWKAYGIKVEATPEQREVSHTGLAYGITASGKRRALYPANLQTSWIVHDVPILAST